ncbi:hypothetical protein EDC17_101129 [Sphingobacterium alimentarium]|uniref:Uncharacterized protein n=1 Tax=Sphingobacterium alimentarium TaxID=797292 RepID=A0A4R3VUD2_9SPHI|nr:hypothetical protein [Sphingobacterium alimentarium]TCV17112.1 hypothetical protein EDC17_101129 [Sphingobacterium alimentarium]
MKILEKDLKKLVREADLTELRERGFPVALPSKRIKDLRVGNYGSVDMIFVDRVDGHFNISLFFFKEGKIGLSAFLESIKLRRGMERYLRKRTGAIKERMKIRIYLIGNEVDTSGRFCYLTDIYCDIGFYIYSFDLHGVSFKESRGYYLSDEGF